MNGKGGISLNDNTIDILVATILMYAGLYAMSGANQSDVLMLKITNLRSYAYLLKDKAFLSYFFIIEFIGIIALYLFVKRLSAPAKESTSID